MASQWSVARGNTHRTGGLWERSSAGGPGGRNRHRTVTPARVLRAVANHGPHQPSNRAAGRAREGSLCEPGRARAKRPRRGHAPARVHGEGGHCESGAGFRLVPAR